MTTRRAFLESLGLALGVGVVAKAGAPPLFGRSHLVPLDASRPMLLTTYSRITPMTYEPTEPGTLRGVEWVDAFTATAHPMLVTRKALR